VPDFSSHTFQANTGHFVTLFAHELASCHARRSNGTGRFSTRVRTRLRLPTAAIVVSSNTKFHRDSRNLRIQLTRRQSENYFMRQEFNTKYCRPFSSRSLFLLVPGIDCGNGVVPNGSDHDTSQGSQYPDGVVDEEIRRDTNIGKRAKRAYKRK
jgi:hypothetical protein